MVSPFRMEGHCGIRKNKNKKALDSNGPAFESPSLVSCVTLVK